MTRIADMVQIQWYTRIFSCSRSTLEFLLNMQHVYPLNNNGVLKKKTKCALLQNTSSIDNQIRHLVYLLENAMLNLPQGQEQMSWLIDFTGWSLRTSVPVKSAKESINILQNHYPERLAVAFLYNPPRVFEAFWKVCTLLLAFEVLIPFKYLKVTSSTCLYADSQVFLG